MDKGKIHQFNRLVLISASILLLQLVIAVPFMLNMERVIAVLFGPALPAPAR